MTTELGKRGAIGTRLARLLRKFRHDARGLAAVEFGMIAPVMMVLLIGTVEITRAVAIHQRFGQVTSMVADLVAREEKLTNDDVKAIYAIADLVMSPYDTQELQISVIPVMSSPTNASNTLVYPEITNRYNRKPGGERAKCQSYPLGAGVVGKNESVVVVETTYTFVPLFLNFIMGESPWKETAMAKPRKGLCVIFDTKCQTSCFS